MTTEPCAMPKDRATSTRLISALARHGRHGRQRRCRKGRRGAGGLQLLRHVLQVAAGLPKRLPRLAHAALRHTRHLTHTGAESKSGFSKPLFRILHTLACLSASQATPRRSTVLPSPRKVGHDVMTAYQ